MNSLIAATDGPVMLVTIDRPERRNAVDAATAAALGDTFRAFDESPTLSVAILTGARGTFCSGFDLKALVGGELRPITEDGDGPMGPTRMTLSKPVIAAVEGYAVAGGLELALWCDLRVAAESAVFAGSNRRFGVPLVDLGTIRLPRLIGHGRAMDLILTGRQVGAREALEMGLVNRVVPNGTTLEEAIKLAREIAAFPQTAVRNDRRSAIEQWDLSTEEAMKNEVRLGIETVESGETAEGAARFAAGEGRHGGPLTGSGAD